MVSFKVNWRNLKETQADQSFPIAASAEPKATFSHIPNPEYCQRSIPTGQTMDKTPASVSSSS